MKKNIILLVAMSLTLSGCGIYTKYKPATSVPDDLYGGEVVTEDTAGLGNMDWRELFTDPHLQSLIETGLRTNTDYQSAQLRVEESSPQLDGGEDAEVALARRDEGRQQHHGVGRQVVRLEMAKLHKGAEEPALREAKAAEEM